MKRLRFLRWPFYASMILVGLFVFLAYVPVMPYKPSCGPSDDRVYLNGSLRPEYKAHLVDSMNSYDITYWKVGDQLLVLYNTILDGDELFSGYDFYNNMEWRITQALAQGQSADGHRIEPPQALLQAIEESEAKFGPYDPSILNDTSGRFASCAVLRAAAIQVETLDEPSS